MLPTFIAGTNRQVANAWANGKFAQSGTMYTNGQDIFSYGLKIGFTENVDWDSPNPALKGTKVAIDYTTKGGAFYSQTTSKHVSYAKGVADRIDKP